MRRKKLNWLRIGLIWLVSAGAVFTVSNFVPLLSNASLNTLFRLRGELSAPDDIVIVAIDDASLQRIGKYPWARSVIADGLDKISAGEPRVVGIDIIYAEESDAEDDERLAQAIKKNGRVVLPTQLFESVNETGQIEIVWLRPLPELEAAVAGEGHAHAAPDVDGTLRSVQLNKADEKGNRFWAFGLETLRVAENIAPNDFEEKRNGLHFGSYKIRLLPEETEKVELAGASLARSDEMLINYTGATKSFRYYSFADVAGGDVAPETFSNKIVLVGATSPTLGDAQVTPFMHFAGSGEREGGQAMPGVEVHANVINTIKNNLSLRFLPDLWGYAIALLIIFSATLAVKWLEGWRQVATLTVILSAIVAGSLLAFNRYFLILPLPEMLTAFLACAPLLLLDRSLGASRDLDSKLQTLSEAQKGFLLDNNRKFNEPNKPGAIVPRNLEWKLRAVDDITTRLLSRMSFINRVLTGMNEGVMVADTMNRIVFVNQRLPRIFETAAANLLNQNLSEFLVERKIFALTELSETIEKVLAGEIAHKEFEETAAQTRHFLLQLSPVSAGEDAAFAGFDEMKNAPVIGILILFFDVTKQRELDRFKAETLQFVSHELRSPLTSIQGLSDVLQKFPVSEDESKEMLETIHSEAVRLNEIITRFLDAKQLESGTRDLQISTVDVENLIADCVSAAAPLAAEKRIEIQFDTNQSLPVLQADAPLLAQVVGNLLSNAVKYSPPETTVSVEVVKLDSELQIIVRDEGYGIPKNALEHIFDKFYRLERDAASETVGTGLGLSFVKEVAEKHGGRVTVKSEEGIGSTFILRLPYQTKLSHLK
ncbi:MAG TPA: CHASE2 domain-containing protein [Pyrinomonadaceae bacterium]|nr:CHASE2 domain-containing protein [Pyrinomonadaceae bacterium]